MKKNTPLLFRVDAGSTCGYGHLSRCLALADAARKSHIPSVFIMRRLDGLPLKLFDPSISVHYLPRTVGYRQDAEFCREIASSINSSWIVIDGYKFKKNYVASLKKAGFYTAMIIDSIDQQPPGIDVIIDQTLKRFALIPPHIRLKRSAKATQSKTLLVSLGGSHFPTRLLAQMSEVLATLEPHVERIDWILAQKLPKNAQQTLPDSVNILPPNADFSTALQSSKIAIVGGGVTLAECAYLGKPSIALILAENQRPHALEFSRSGSTFTYEAFPRLNINRIVQGFKHIIDDDKLYTRMSRAGKKMIDGRGAERVIRALKPHFLEAA